MQWCLAVVATLLSVPLAAETRLAALELEPLVVAASKSPSASDEIAATVSVIDRDEIERQMATDIAELVRYEPGISVANQGSRFGRDGFSIRGVGGNRVQIEVDGVDAAQSFAIGSFSNAGRDFVDLDAIKQVEIVRGPTSALFGSDALGGVVSFVTMDPADYLNGSDWHADARLGFDSADHSRHAGAGVALRGGDLGQFSGLLRVVRRDFEALDNAQADPLDGSTDSFLGKFLYGEAGAGALRLTVDWLDSDGRVAVDSLEGRQDFSALFGFPFLVQTTEVAADDERTRRRFSLDQEWLNGTGPFSYARWQVYRQDSETLQDTLERRTEIAFGNARPVERLRRFDYEEVLEGAEFTLVNAFATGRLRHELTWGLEFENHDVTQLRDGRERDLASGEISNTVGPDVFPVRDFPLSSTRNLGLYLQDRIELRPDLQLIPGLRVDRYTLDGRNDPVFSEDNPGVAVTDLRETQVSPKLGLLWTLGESQLFASYAEGWRAPPVTDVNVGFTNFQFGYTSLPNPDLAPETSRGLELGWRHQTAVWRLETSIFHSEYEDFIDSFRLVGFDPVRELLIFQSVNLDEVSIHGAEARFSLQLGAHWRTFLNAAYARGDNERTGQPLNSVEPLTGLWGIAYDRGEGFGATGIVRLVDGKHRVDGTDQPLLQPDGYGVVDLFGHWRPRSELRLRAGVFNLLDRQFLAWSDVRGLPEDSVAAKRLRSPGRSFSVFLDLDF